MLTCQKHVLFTSVRQRALSHPIGQGQGTLTVHKTIFDDVTWSGPSESGTAVSVRPKPG